VVPKAAHAAVGRCAAAAEPIPSNRGLPTGRRYWPAVWVLLPCVAGERGGSRWSTYAWAQSSMAPAVIDAPPGNAGTPKTRASGEFRWGLYVQRTRSGPQGRSPPCAGRWDSNPGPSPIRKPATQQSIGSIKSRLEKNRTRSSVEKFEPPPIFLLGANLRPESSVFFRSQKVPLRAGPVQTHERCRKPWTFGPRRDDGVGCHHRLT